MIKAEYNDRQRVVDILANSFDDNKSVNYIIKQDATREKRLRKLMEYSFDICFLFGDVFLSDDKKGCALLQFPEKKKTTFKSILLDIKFITSCVGLASVKKILDREGRIKKLHPETLMYYLWFIGVDPGEQSNGVGSALMNDIIEQGISMDRPICLETSTLKNLPWYKKFGFQIYNELDLGYKLFFLKRELTEIQQ